ncbi:multidrug efflux SMR transporter [Erwinia sp. PK3-005]|uniref:Spermidine export protein MdtJ n=1 Tax=Mixta hanseatica TaxID=2872648 RepID=A0ABY4R4Z8_9GAMM|nr:multidrug efflux SMR transporter [Mixta hanseatica]UQY43333.1 multidrug efflux SMR transporter [Mixta hanseatica]
MSRAWCYLFLAIVAEVSSVVVMKLLSREAHWAGMLLMYFTIGLSFTFMALALKKIALAVAYATWESLGLLAVAAIGSLFFKEHLSVMQFIAIFLLLGGVMLVNIAENEHRES